MSKNNKSAASPSRPQRDQPKGTRDFTRGYQPERGKVSPTKPPTNPPNKGSSGKK